MSKSGTPAKREKKSKVVNKDQYIAHLEGQMNTARNRIAYLTEQAQQRNVFAKMLGAMVQHHGQIVMLEPAMQAAPPFTVEVKEEGGVVSYIMTSKPPEAPAADVVPFAQPAPDSTFEEANLAPPAEEPANV